MTYSEAVELAKSLRELGWYAAVRYMCKDVQGRDCYHVIVTGSAVEAGKAYLPI